MDTESIEPQRRWWTRWYHTKRWQRMRSWQLTVEPHCRMCTRRGRAGSCATDVDHIKPHRGNADLFFDPENLQSLCKTCHSSIKQELERNPLRGTLPNGRPASPHHWWNQARGSRR
jgi:5-methylcytosine-specific restriction enzyme A